MKRCPKCFTTKLDSLFYFNKRLCRISSYCKECTNKISSENSKRYLSNTLTRSVKPSATRLNELIHVLNKNVLPITIDELSAITIFNRHEIYNTLHAPKNRELFVVEKIKKCNYYKLSEYGHATIDKTHKTIDSIYKIFYALTKCRCKHWQTHARFKNGKELSAYTRRCI